MKEEKVSPANRVIQTSCTDEEYDAIRKAADSTKRSMASYLLFYGLEAAKEINRQ